MVLDSIHKRLLDAVEEDASEEDNDQIATIAYHQTL
jgi:hypothetical protein